MMRMVVATQRVACRCRARRSVVGVAAELAGVRPSRVGGLDDPSHAEPSWLLLQAGILGASPLDVDVVTTDSGPLHVAGVLEHPIVVLFRNQNPVHERRYETLSPVLGHNEACQARCSVYRCRGTNPHLLTEPCAEMSAIVPEDVLRGFERMGMAPGAHGERPPV